MKSKTKTIAAVIKISIRNDTRPSFTAAQLTHKDIIAFRKTTMAAADEPDLAFEFSIAPRTETGTMNALPKHCMHIANRIKNMFVRKILKIISIKSKANTAVAKGPDLLAYFIPNSLTEYLYREVEIILKTKGSDCRRTTLNSE